MKPSSIFINTARGGIHNEEDLIDALQNGIIWGAGLDVTNPEPMQKDNPLLTMPNAAVCRISEAPLLKQEMLWQILRPIILLQV